MHKSKNSVNVISKEKKDIDKKLDKDFLKRFSHLKELLKEIKDKEIKEEVKKDIEDIKEEIESKDTVKFDLHLIEDAVARAENILQANRINKNTDDYNALAERTSLQQRQQQDSRLENTISRLAEDLPKDKNNAQLNYSGSGSEYGRAYMDKYESVKYGLRKEDERRRREQEAGMVARTDDYNERDKFTEEHSKDIYITETKKRKN